MCRGSAARRDNNNPGTADAGHDGRYRQTDKWNDPRMGSSVDSRELAPVHGLMNGVGMVGAVSPVGMGITSLPPMGHMNAHMQLVRGWNTQQPNMTGRAPMGSKPVAPILPRPAIPNSDHPSTATNGHHPHAMYARSTNSAESPNNRSRAATSVTTLSNFLDPVLGFDDNRPSTDGSSHRSQAYYNTPADAGIVTEQEARYLYDQ